MLTPSMLSFLTYEMGMIGEPAAWGGPVGICRGKEVQAPCSITEQPAAVLSPNTAGEPHGEWEGAVCAPGSGYRKRFLGERHSLG